MNGKCQTMDAVYDCCATPPEPRKIYFRLAEGKWKKCFITIKLHLTTNDIYMRRHFQAMCGI